MKKEKIKDLVREAKNEVVKYRKNKRLVYLLQASEKIWVAFSLLLERLSNREIHNYPEFKRVKNNLIRKGKISGTLYERAYFLHVFHYEGWADPSEVMKFINFCSREILRLNKT